MHKYIHKYTYINNILHLFISDVVLFIICVYLFFFVIISVALWVNVLAFLDLNV